MSALGMYDECEICKCRGDVNVCDIRGVHCNPCIDCNGDNKNITDPYERDKNYYFFIPEDKDCEIYELKMKNNNNNKK